MMSKRVMMMMIVCCSVRVIVLIAADVYMSFIRMCVCQGPLFSNTTEKKKMFTHQKKTKKHAEISKFLYYTFQFTL